MSVRRALVDCVVLSPQDACVLYPCCRGCFTRMDVTTQDRASCFKEQLEYRYRLSLRVTRDRRIFGVTVFGSCLNPFFGVHATEFQRLVENGPSETSTRSKLLAKAVEDCFIGRRLVFGMKVTDCQSRPWLEDHVPGGSDCQDMVQFTATQMIFPKATGMEGCSVIRYYQQLLQRAAEQQRESADSNQSYTFPTTPLISQDSSASSFNVTLSRLLPHSLQRSQRHDGSLTPTPPWQQSLGLVTSSAENEEEENENKQTACLIGKCCTVNHDTREEKGSFLSSKSSSFAEYSSVKNILNCLNPSPSPQLDSEGKASPQPDNSFMLRSLAWDDLPLSESLEQFLSEEGKYVYPGDTKASGIGSRVLADITNNTSVQSSGGDADEDAYSCSQDLFSLSSALNTQEEAQPGLYAQELQTHPSVTIVIPEGQTPAGDTVTPLVEFSPSSQSTPIVKVDLSSSSIRNFSKRRSRKHHSTILKTRECDLSVWNMPLSQLEDSEVLIPPTPAVTNVKAVCSQEEMPPHVLHRKRILLAPSLASSKRDGVTLSLPTKNDAGGGDSNEKTAVDSLAEEEACDWSRDLFSDSV
ncbi:DNA damage-induced apoptosis suppressor protein isoform X2 [Dunckerocampus dactyliophorus]|uniref:DNA damage-induced apoptosis suppressor protein isoform X2 n=1 Tax=Dunckerocampus dactyliophorus TaxID=161453 RepID=UPI00240656C9|nr:DNA damage-induced apoptosis suppressor protein isoform X2 [Dunckerocampus dactyliophorus]